MVKNNNEVYQTLDYIPEFKCVGKDCIDSCCIGWNIEFDKKTYQKYKNSSDKIINSISQKYVVKKEIKSDMAYAKVQQKKNSCPFLTKNNLCKAHSLLGKENLSLGCATYPRIIKKFKSTSFISGELSCPEIARLCLSKPNLKTKELTKDKLENIFNSNQIHSFEIPRDLPKDIMEFIKKTILKLSNKDTLFKNLEEIIQSLCKIHNVAKSRDFLSEKEKGILKENNLLMQIDFFPKFFFTNLADHSRFLKICIRAAQKSMYFNYSKKEFKKNFMYNYKYKFKKFMRENQFILKNFFKNEFIKNVEKFEISIDVFDNFIREVLFQINLSNFLIICLLFEDKKRLTIDDYIEVMSAISKDIQNSDEKKKLITNFFKKIDKNNLSIRLFDIY